MRGSFKITLMIFMLLSSLLFCSCSSGGGAFSDLLSPPAVNEEMKVIRSTVEKIEKKSISPVSPVSGTYRSAIFTLDTEDETKGKTAAVYTVSGDKRISVMLLGKNGTEYVETAKVSAAATGVDFVEFYDFTGDGRSDMAVGWMVSTGRGLSIYDFSSGGVTEILNTKYNAVNFNTVADRSVRTVFVAQNGDKEHTAIGKYIMAVGGQLQSVSEVRMSSDISAYSSIVQGKAGDCDALYINEITEGHLVNTEIIGIVNNTLINFTTDAQGEFKYGDKLCHSDPVIAQDMDGDNEIELAIPYEYKIISDIENAVKIHNWCVFVPDSAGNATLHTKYYAVHNFAERYFILFPDRWLGKVYVKRDASWSTLSFYYRNTGGDDLLLYTVSAMSAEAYHGALPQTDNQLVKLTGERAYLVKFSSDIPSKAKRYVPSLKELQALFNQKTIKQI